MDWIVQIIEFLRQNYQIIKDNLFLFVLWTGLCIGVSLSISSWNNNRLNEENVKLKAENQVLLDKYTALSKKYSEMDEKTRLLCGTGDFSCTTAKTMSQKINS